MFTHPSRKCIVATCNLNQWALDFDDNLIRIQQSIRLAKSKQAKFRVGPELEIPGYSCEDHFLELDTFLHSYESLAQLLADDTTDDILCSIGCPVLHRNVRYNCQIFCYNRQILLIRPKCYLADDGNYRERRFFASWPLELSQLNQNVLDDFILPPILQEATKQISVPIGIAMIRTKETIIAAEVCEELWSPKSPHVNFYLSGAEIICNASGSHHQLRKLSNRLTLIQNATSKCGGLYIYANHRGCDGNRMYFDGSSLICLNGELLRQASQFSLRDVEVITAVVDLNHITDFRQQSASLQTMSTETQSISHKTLPIIDVPFSIILPQNMQMTEHITTSVAPRIHLPEEECALGPACWLWDYLRRSGASGYLLPLSGGADSTSVATIVYCMCVLAIQEAQDGNKQVRSDISSIVNRSNRKDKSNQYDMTHIISDNEIAVNTPEELCSYILHAVYLGSINSSAATKRRSIEMAQAIGAYHISLPIDTIVNAILNVFTAITPNHCIPKFESQGGSKVEDIALQNIQARIRMVLSYLCAQLFPWVRGRNGFLLVLSAGNVDEALRGYMTKYDCSSGDVNPIGGICKSDLRKLLRWASTTYNMPIIDEVVRAPPSAELRPIAENEVNDYSQIDEEDMGMTYDELSVFGLLRKVYRCGPLTMFMRLLSQWKHLSPSLVSEKVKRFFYFYSLNRHKMTTLTPSYHAENYSPDDNRFDLRQFLYNVKWTRQFQSIDNVIKRMKDERSSVVV